jgi:hypothetical protein
MPSPHRRERTQQHLATQAHLACQPCGASRRDCQYLRMAIIAIDGLWALLPGTANSGGTDAVWFSAGPDEETHGLLGVLRPAS